MQNGHAKDEKEERIKNRAYQHWLNEGQFPDSDKLNWERAKREIEEEDRALLEKNSGL
jgi:hypothetical protein